MRDDQKQYFMEMELLFSQPGWQRLQEGWRAEKEALAEATFWNARNFEDVMLARERFAMLEQLTELADAIQEQKEQVEIGADETDSV